MSRHIYILTVGDPEIFVVQSLSETFVFVLDFSSSMATHTRETRMKKGIERFMMLDVDLHKIFSIGVTSFSSRAYIIQPIIPISDNSSRDQVIKAVNDESAGGGTCLQEGILKGLEALRLYNKPKGGASILLTDGQNGCGDNDWLGEVIDEVQEQDVRHCTIAFSNDADPDLMLLLAVWISYPQYHLEIKIPFCSSNPIKMLHLCLKEFQLINIVAKMSVFRLITNCRHLILAQLKLQVVLDLRIELSREKALWKFHFHLLLLIQTLV